MRRRRINLTKESLSKYFVKIRRIFLSRKKIYLRTQIEEEYD